MLAAPQAPAVEAKPPPASQNQDIIARKNRLAEQHRQCNEVYAEAQRRVSTLLAQVSQSGPGESCMHTDSFSCLA